ncbi:hypothetical protein [Streptomyces violascens]|uniref:hypothetical protein n=1 Tax=Streptomyces violascens TaxID=67381 RepID=UPI003669F63B
MNGLWTTAMAGAAADLGVAVPVGAVGVLLIQEGMRERRGAMAAAAAVAAAVATVDLVYAALATALGPLVAEALSGVEAWRRGCGWCRPWCLRRSRGGGCGGRGERGVRRARTVR